MMLCPRVIQFEFIGKEEVRKEELWCGLLSTGNGPTQHFGNGRFVGWWGDYVASSPYP